ncbi:MAG: inositol monophosphatase [Rhodobiaceae bacterium]|nr:inositol monophosphatase [Rhodobiaceae bacterium]
MARSALLGIMVQAASRAGRALTRDFGEVEKLQVSVKGPADFVSNADKRAEKILFEDLSKARPEYSFLMEESGEVKGKDKSHRWLIDPLDGTTNFLHGRPHFCISIALEREDKLAAALIYNPISNELFTAERGAGAFFNDTRIRVSGRRTLSEALIGFTMPGLGRTQIAAAEYRQLADLTPRVVGFRDSGSAALDLAWLAAGRLDGLFLTKLSPWDMAAGILMVREAGGFVTDIHGGERMYETGAVVGGNAEIHPALQQLLARSAPK